MELVGPLPKSTQGHKYIVVILDYGTQYPEVVPLRKNHLPESLLTDQGTPFVLKLMSDFCQLLQVSISRRPSTNLKQTVWSDDLIKR